MKLRYFSILLFLTFNLALMAQNVTIKGRVTDAANKIPLIGANVLIKGTVVGTITDLDGNFNLTTSQSLPLTLRVSLIGFASQDIQVESADAMLDIALGEETETLEQVTVTSNRVEESITKAPVTVEKITARKLLNSSAFDSYGALQGIKGVDLLSQSLTFRSVNMRGFGANNNNRFVQWVDGMDNRSPGLGFGFGNVAGPSDLDIENIEILPGASSALYGPDALQGIMLTKTKSPFDFQGLSAQVTTGLNNVGKDDFGAKLYSDVAVRYAAKLGEKFAFKVNFQTINGTDFIADDYSDRSTRARPGFFVTDQNAKEVRIGFVPNSNPGANLEFDAVNIYGDDINNGGVSAAFGATAPTALVGKRVTRTGYTELDLLNNNGKIFSNRANVALHYKLGEKMEVIGAWYYGTGNFIRTAGFREYFPEYKRNQAKLELRGDNFFVRGYGTFQQAEGFNLGNLATRMLQQWKTTAAWGNDFATAFGANGGNISAARATADNGKPLPGTAAFDQLWTNLTNTPNNQFIPGSTTIRGVRLLDNSTMYHAEGMYNLKRLLPEKFEVVTGGNFRRFLMKTDGTIFPRTKSGEEFTINEIGWYLQGSYNLTFSDKVAFKPTVAVRYDKNQYLTGGFTPRVSGVLTLGEHNFRGSFQAAFRNPSANQLLADGAIGEVGGSRTAVEAANLFNNPAYTEASVNVYRAGGNNASLLVKYTPDPDAFSTEKINTWEIGYKTLLGKKLFVDLFYFNSTYNDFIAAQNFVQPVNGNVTDLAASATSRAIQVNFNNFNEIFVTGFGGGLEWALGKGYNLALNYANQVGKITLRDNSGNIRKDAFGAEVIKRKMSNLEVSALGRNFFISPENRFNITLSNPKVTDRIGFAVSYRWTDDMWVEQGTTAGDILLPSWSTLDANVQYRIPKAKATIKLGATNMLNNYYSQGYGLAQIGGMYYLTLRFN
jgi:outer membrane receptor protein involved in Fe transport